jgi:iron complex outermembrane receptor protein
MKKIIITLLMLTSFYVFARSAREGSIKGKVMNNENEPIAGANVVLTGTQFGTATLNDGTFGIGPLPFGDYTLSITMIGYAKKTIPVTLDSSYSPITIILSEQTIQGKQIIVSASKYKQKIEDLTVSTTVIQPDFIDRNNFQTFDEMLRSVPGIQMNLEQPSIRGSSGYSKGTGARVLVAVNGIPMYTGDTGEIIWELIPTTEIERVEIIKGPASSLYGSSAIGGVINIITKSSVKKAITHLSTYFGAYDNPSYDIWKWTDKTRTFYGIGITHSDSYKDLGYTFSFKKFDNMSYRENDFSKRYLGYLKLNYSFTPENNVTFFADFLNMDRGNFLYWGNSRQYALVDISSAGNTVKSNRLFTGLIYHHSFNENTFAELKSSYYYTKFDGYGKELTESIANLVRNELMVNSKLSYDWILTSGLEMSYSKISSSIFSSPHFLGEGAYIQAEYDGIEKLIAVIGLRYDYIKIDSLGAANAVTPKAGLNYKLTKDLILRTSLGTGFRAPTPSEVFTTAAVANGINVKSNPDLKSESSISFEVGALYNCLENLSFDFALFQTDYKNFIEADLINDSTIKFVNLSKARIQGMELNSTWSIVPGELKLLIGYDYMWARNLDNNTAMKYRPRNTFNAQLRYTPYPFEFGINFRYASRVEEIDDLFSKLVVKDGDLRVPIYVTDVSIGYNIMFGEVPSKIYINIKNIFNYNYVEFIGNIAPIRNASLSWDIYF